MKWPELMCVTAFGGGGNYDAPKEWHTVCIFLSQSTLVEQHSSQKGFGFMDELQIM